MDIMIGILIIIAIATAVIALCIDAGNRAVKSGEQEKKGTCKRDKDKCPNCRLPFSVWFWWPGKGDYCWPCYKVTGKIFVREASE